VADGGREEAAVSEVLAADHPAAAEPAGDGSSLKTSWKVAASDAGLLPGEGILEKVNIASCKRK